MRTPAAPQRLDGPATRTGRTSWPIPFRNRLGVRLAFYYTLLIISALSLVAFLAFYVAQRSLERELAQKLLGTARLIRALPGHESLLWLRPGDEGTPLHRSWIRRLERIREAMGVRDIFVFDRQYHVLVDLDQEVPIGAPYRMLVLDQVELEAVWNGQEADSVLYQGSDGHYYKSGYVPLQNEKGEVVAVVGVEGGADFLPVLTTLRRRLFLVAAGSILVTVGLSWLVARSLLHPLGRLIETIHAVSRSGTPETVQMANRGDEIGYLGKRFNEMMRALSDQEQTLWRLYRMEKERAEIIHRISAGLAHEIRNPLGALTGYAELLQRRLQEPEGASASRPLLEGLQHEVQILNRVVTDFLTYAREPRLQRERVEIPPLVKRTLEAALADHQVAREKVQVQLQFAPDLPPIQADPVALRKALYNIILNALEAMGANGGLLAVEAHPAPREVAGVAIRIQDTGPGIPESLLERIFHPFFTTKEEGSGLGLAITRKMIEAHGGTIHVTSGEGKGATFVLWLPEKEANRHEANPDRGR